MTTKEIANAIGKPEQTVRNWLRDLASKSDVIKSKLDMSSSRYPADWDINETCLIIEEGMGKDVANAFRTNAVNAEVSAKIAQRETNQTDDWRRIRELRIAFEKGGISPAQFQTMIGAPVISAPALLPALTQPQLSLLAHRPIKSKAEGERRMLQACQIDAEKMFDPVIFGASIEAIDKAIRLARLPKKQRYTQKEEHSLLWQLLFGKEINPAKNTVF